LFDPLAYYSPETLAFPAIAQSFADTGILEPAALYLILDWKAPRARTKHRDRLVKTAGSFNAAVNAIATRLHAATGPQQRLCLLVTEWGFRLPTASAILTVLYPDEFTVYDVRVCNALEDFHKLGNMPWSPAAWEEYQVFIGAVRDCAARAGAPPGTSLRDCDRWLWGQDKREMLREELGEAI
jgi:hypothetical protein